jgi:hypothetical protein
MKLPARRAHQRLWTVLVALAVATGGLLYSGKLDIRFPIGLTPPVEL